MVNNKNYVVHCRKLNITNITTYIHVVILVCTCSLLQHGQKFNFSALFQKRKLLKLSCTSFPYTTMIYVIFLSAVLYSNNC